MHMVSSTRPVPYTTTFILKMDQIILKGQPIFQDKSLQIHTFVHINLQNFVNTSCSFPPSKLPSSPSTVSYCVTDANVTLMGLWLEKRVKGKGRVIDRYRVRWQAKKAVDKNECRDTTRGIQGGETGAVEELIRETVVAFSNLSLTDRYK